MVVVDSNILIYHLDDALPPDARDQVDNLIVNGAAISVITRIEVLGSESASHSFLLPP